MDVEEQTYEALVNLHAAIRKLRAAAELGRVDAKAAYDVDPWCDDAGFHDGCSLSYALMIGLMDRLMKDHDIAP